MKKRIKRFGVIQTSVVVATIYFAITAVFMIPFGIIFTAVGNNVENFGFGGFGGAFFIIAPFFYGVLAFFMTAIGCLIYNLISKYIGGIEVEVDNLD